MNKRVMLASAIVALSVALLVWVTQAARAQERPSASAPALVAAPREQTQLFLPLVLKNYMPPAPLWRFGVSQLRRPFTDYDYNDIIAMRFGWYMNFGATPNAPQPYGIEYSPVIRVKQWKLKDGSTWTECCVGCPYVTPYTYTVSPSVSQIQAMATSRPGMLWVIGNEMDRIDFNWGGSCMRQDEMLPELYAQAYHDIYYTIKNADSTAQVAIGGMIGFTDLRRRYLDRVWAEYIRLYSETMPVDVWNVHLYVLREGRTGWGASIPPGFNEDTGALYDILDHKDFNKAWEFVIGIRNWMSQHEQRNKPLITNEYGVLMPSWIECPTFPDTHGCPFTPEPIRDGFLYPSFNYFLTRTDANLGYPADGNRLIQRWNWWSLDYDEGVCDEGIFVDSLNGALFYSGLGPSSPPRDCSFPQKGIAPLGTYWRQYVKTLPSESTRPYASAQISVLSTRKTISVTSPTYEPATSDCPKEQRIRLQFYTPASPLSLIAGISDRIDKSRSFVSSVASEMLVCIPVPTK